MFVVVRSELGLGVEVGDFVGDKAGVVVGEVGVVRVFVGDSSCVVVVIGDVVVVVRASVLEGDTEGELSSLFGEFAEL